MNNRVLVTCEHASNKIPKDLLSYHLKFSKKLLQSHYAWDIGTSKILDHLSNYKEFKCHKGEISRLVVDLNRSLDSKSLWSNKSKKLSIQQKEFILNKYYHPYRDKIINDLDRFFNMKKKLTIVSIHSFTPVFNDKMRGTDIGILFNHRSEEIKFANLIKQGLKEKLKDFKIHFNLPYRGNTDCFLNDLIDKYSSNYQLNSTFIEINQKHLNTDFKIKKISEALVSVFRNNSI